MMRTIWLTLACSLLVLSTSAFADVEVVYRRVQLVPGAHRYSIQVSRRFQTTLLFPVECYDVELGDGELFAASVDKLRKRRISVNANTNDPRASTNMTVHCEDLNVIIRISVPPQGQHKGQLIDFAYSKEADDRVVSAIKRTREEQENRFRREIEEIKKQHVAALKKQAIELTKQQNLGLLEGAVNHLDWSDTRESTRHDYIVVHIRQRIAIGHEKLIVLELRNRSSTALEIAEVAIIRSSDATRIQAVLCWPERVRLGDDERIRMGVSFASDATTDKYKLLIKGNSSRWVEVVELRI